MANTHRVMQRRLTILRVLTGLRRGLTKARLRARLADDGLSVSTRTLERDLRALQLAGWPVRREVTNGETRWALHGDAPPQQGLSAQDQAALRLALDALHPVAFPTCVGMNRTRPSGATRKSTVPHVCGDEPHSCAPLRVLCCRSPRVWG